MASKQANKRLTKEYLQVQKNPIPFIVTKPKEDNILEWHYVITGPEDSPYVGGEYWGKIIFPTDYPFKPPGIKMMTPNGRFKTDYRLCLSMSDYHPDTWNPAWSVSTILTGLLSFMLEDTATTGSVTTTIPEKKILAKQSSAFNLSKPIFTDLFPELVQPSSQPIPPTQGEYQQPSTEEQSSKPPSSENRRFRCRKRKGTSEDPIDIE